MITEIVKQIKHSGGNFIRFFYHIYLQSAGVEIGKNTMISLGAKIDTRRGMVVIGNNCTITHGTVILSHDAAAARMNKTKGEGTTIIEDNVFIGVNSVVLPGVTIGLSSIIGAGSVVTTDTPPKSVAVGNPAKVIKTLV
jgi:acetyltransferase-like isoleucine patch superfamily enzyme